MNNGMQASAGSICISRLVWAAMRTCRRAESEGFYASMPHQFMRFSSNISAA